MALIENRAEITYAAVAHHVLGAHAKFQQKVHIRRLKQFISSIDDDYKNLRFVGEDLITDLEAVALVQHGWDPTYVASLYLAGIVSAGEESFEKIRELFAQRNTWYSDANFESVQNVYNEEHIEKGFSFSSIISSHHCKKVLESDSEMASMMKSGSVYINLRDKHADIRKLFDPTYYPFSNLSSLLESMFSSSNGNSPVRLGEYKYHISRRYADKTITWKSSPTKDYDKFKSDFPDDNDLPVLLSSQARYDRGAHQQSIQNLKGETLIRQIVPAIAKHIRQIAFSNRQIHRLENLKDEMKACLSSDQTEISLIHTIPVDLSDIKLARSSSNIVDPVLYNHRVVQTGETIDRGLIPEIILSRIESTTLTMKQKFAVTGYRDVVLVSTSRTSGGLVIPRAGFFDLFENHLESQTLSHSVTPGDIIDAYHLASVICRDRIGHKKLL